MLMSRFYLSFLQVDAGLTMVRRYLGDPSLGCDDLTTPSRGCLDFQISRYMKARGISIQGCHQSFTNLYPNLASISEWIYTYSQEMTDAGL